MDYTFDQLSTGKYGRMWDVLHTELFVKDRNEYNLGLAPEINQGHVGDCTIIAAMSSIASDPANL